THEVIGHTERRAYYNETDETVNHKTIAASKYGLTTIICLAKTLQKREANETLTHIETQVTEALKGLSNEQIEKTIIAYEPIWAIGTGKTASSADANEVCMHIRKVVANITSDSVAEQIVIQYGESVK